MVFKVNRELFVSIGNKIKSSIATKCKIELVCYFVPSGYEEIVKQFIEL